tara:strand:- start:82 stop:378 length:297 start_codon:yes stop_codon:yes gene_type:complete
MESQLFGFNQLIFFMTNNNEISTPSKEIKKTFKCRNCYIIRLFLLAVVFIILFALIQSENLHYLDFVTPTNAATLIIIIGVIMFLIKLTNYLFEKKNN